MYAGLGQPGAGRRRSRRDAVSGAPLDTRMSGFLEGRYYADDPRPRGDPVVNNGGVNAVVSGLFFAP